MKKNIGDIDAIIRIMLGFVLAYFYYVTNEPSVWNTLGLALAGLLMLTAVHGNDPVYRLLKVNTCKAKSCNAADNAPENTCSSCTGCDSCK